MPLFKSRKAPLSLNSLSNALKTHGSKSLSPEEINPKTIDVNVINQLGIPQDSIVAVAYDPIQSLLAISTTHNDVRVYGQVNVEVVFEFNIKHPITFLRFVKGVYLLCGSPAAGLTILSLYSKKILGKTSFPGTVTTFETDPALDWLVVGLANGSILFYDIDRMNMTPFRIDNLQKQVMPKEKMSPVVSIEWHPRDIGTFLITYNQCAIVYSLVSAEIKCVLKYELSKQHRAFGYSMHIVNGGKKKLFGSQKTVRPFLTEAHFHPNGLHAVTVHNDNSIVFWDLDGGVILEARTLFETSIHKEGNPLELPEIFNPIESVAWVCGEDPENTKLLISGGDPKSCNSIHVLDFGYTLKYSLTSYETQGKFYATPQNGERKIPVNFYLNRTEVAEVIKIIQPITNNGSPYFHGGHNPAHLLLVSNLGRIYFVPFAATATNSGGASSSDLGTIILPTSISLIHPPMSYIDVKQVVRLDWYSIMSSRVSSGTNSKMEPLLKGGAPTSFNNLPKPLGYNDTKRNIMITGHENGLVRFIDVTKGEQSGTESIVQISLRESLYDYDNPNNLRVMQVSCSFSNRQLLVGLATGEVVICKFGKFKATGNGYAINQDYSSCPMQHCNGSASILDITSRIPGSVASSATFTPINLLRLDPSEQISVLLMSDAGFAAVGYKSGRLVVCDISRGPAVIFNLANIKENLVSVTGNCYVTSLEFTIMEYGTDGYSSLILIVGTNGGGNLLYYKIMPMGNGGFQVEVADKTTHLNHRSSNDGNPEASKISQVLPIESQYGLSAVADQEKFNRLVEGIPIPGLVITVSDRDIRVINIPKAKLAHKVMDDSCLKATVVQYKDKGVVLAVLVKTGFIKLVSLPALQDIANIKLPKEVYSKLQVSLESGTASQSDLLSSGEMFLRLTTTESVYILAYEKSRQKGGFETDTLFNPDLIIPPRPVASTLSWAKGQIRYVSVKDLTLLIAGPNRKAPKTEESKLAHQISPEANPQNNYGGYNPKPKAERGYNEPVRRSTANQGYGFGGQGLVKSLQDGLQSAEETINDYANNATEAFTEGYEDQKKSFYSSALKSKFGF
ncbi:SRO7 [Candida oxycetoniae]|uniref:SRO7 n=1 Tax=Candida oxycetoniae TaxID=497107 RepID=A0AAI9T1T6_9ASCO|nr:SRO7 [Candida oxycetoniae]KAI3407099.2 SRO7 [Candida oxycetoniae]